MKIIKLTVKHCVLNCSNQKLFAILSHCLFFLLLFFLNQARDASKKIELNKASQFFCFCCFFLRRDSRTILLKKYDKGGYCFCKSRACKSLWVVNNMYLVKSKVVLTLYPLHFRGEVRKIFSSVSQDMCSYRTCWHEGFDQPAHPLGLVRAFPVCLQNHLIPQNIAPDNITKNTPIQIYTTTSL